MLSVGEDSAFSQAEGNLQASNLGLTLTTPLDSVDDVFSLVSGTQGTMAPRSSLGCMGRRVTVSEAGQRAMAAMSFWLGAQKKLHKHLQDKEQQKHRLPCEKRDIPLHKAVGSLRRQEGAACPPMSPFSAPASTWALSPPLKCKELGISLAPCPVCSVSPQTPCTPAPLATMPVTSLGQPLNSLCHGFRVG